MNTTSLTKMQRELVAVTEERDRLAAELAKLRAAPALPAPTPFTPDADTRRNDEAFAAQQAATAPSVPDGMMLVKAQDANNYCRILTLLGMEDEGDPVGAVSAMLNQRAAGVSENE